MRITILSLLAARCIVASSSDISISDWKALYIGFAGRAVAILDEFAGNSSSGDFQWWLAKGNLLSAVRWGSDFFEWEGVEYMTHNDIDIQVATSGDSEWLRVTDKLTEMVGDSNALGNWSSKSCTRSVEEFVCTSSLRLTPQCEVHRQSFLALEITRLKVFKSVNRLSLYPSEAIRDWFSNFQIPPNSVIEGEQAIPYFGLYVGGDRGAPSPRFAEWNGIRVPIPYDYLRLLERWNKNEYRNYVFPRGTCWFKPVQGNNQTLHDVVDTERERVEFYCHPYIQLLEERSGRGRLRLPSHDTCTAFNQFKDLRLAQKVCQTSRYLRSSGRPYFPSACNQYQIFLRHAPAELRNASKIVHVI